MKTAYISLFGAIVSIVAATPGQLLSSRKLTRAENNSTSCPGRLIPGQYEAPSYITQISAANTSQTFGTSPNVVFTPYDIATIFAFQIPVSRVNYTCTLEFLFPSLNQLNHSSYNYTGAGTFNFTGYTTGSCPDASTSYDNQPSQRAHATFPPIHMEPGNAYTIDAGPCAVAIAAGGCISGLTSTLDTNFEYYQSAQDCPIGIYTTYSMGPANFTPGGFISGGLGDGVNVTSGQDFTVQTSQTSLAVENHARSNMLLGLGLLVAAFFCTG